MACTAPRTYGVPSGRSAGNPAASRAFAAASMRLVLSAKVTRLFCQSDWATQPFHLDVFTAEMLTLILGLLMDASHIGG